MNRDKLTDTERQFVDAMRMASDVFHPYTKSEIDALIAIVDRIAPLPVDNDNFGLLHSPEEPQKPKTLRRKFDGRLKKAIRGYYGVDPDYGQTMNDLTADVTDDEWDVICAVLDALPTQPNRVSLKVAYRISDEIRAAKAGAK